MMTESDLSSPTSTSDPHDMSHDRMEDRAVYRKSNKPQMEKKRRARINQSLGQLKSLVLQAMKKDNSQYSKLEKADILELTVKHLKDVERYQARNALSQPPDAMTKYRAGYNECANEVIRYLGQSQGVNDDARSRMMSHLSNILTPINSLSLQQGPTPILPAPPATMATVSQQQQQLQHLQQQHQYHLQQQQHVAFLGASGQRLNLDSNNNNHIVKLEPSYAPITSIEAMNIANVSTAVTARSTTSPTAFQAPICNTVTSHTGSGSLQVPCIATATMGTTQYQLVPSALPNGQVTLVLAPQPVPSMNIDVHTHHTSQRTLLHEKPLQLSENPSIAIELQKKGLLSNESPVSLVTKPTRRSPKTVQTPPSNRKAEPIPTFAERTTSPTVIPSMSLYQGHSEHILRTSPVAHRILSVSPSDVTTTLSNSLLVNTATATSTWRPW